MSNKTDQDNLLILWMNDNFETAKKMVFMYAGNSKKKSMVATGDFVDLGGHY